MKTFKLYNGVEVPTLAYGTYQIPNNQLGYEALKYAIDDVNYRHIDTASSYNNEYLIAQVIEESKLNREDFFISTKLWNTEQGYDKTLAAFERSCKELRTDYIDLYMIHWPIPLGHAKDYQELNYQTWRAFEKLYKEKRVRAIGVCNFLAHHLIALESQCEIMPMVNQLEFNPYYQQRPTVAYCHYQNILVEGWAPLMRGVALMKKEFQEIAAKYNCSINQLCLRYCLQKDVLPIARSLEKGVIKENKDIFSFTISEDDMLTLDNLNTFTDYTFHPDRNDEWFK